MNHGDSRKVIALTAFSKFLINSKALSILSDNLEKFLLEFGLSSFIIPLELDQISLWANTNKGSYLPSPYNALSPYIQWEILKRPNNILHLRSPRTFTEEDATWVSSHLNRLSAELNLNAVLLDSGNFIGDSLTALRRNLSKAISLSMQNSGIISADKELLRRGSIELQMLFSIERFLRMNPGIQLSFNFAHWCELGRTLNEQELFRFIRRLRGRIARFHFGAPAGIGHPTGTNERYLLVKNSLFTLSHALFRELGKDATIVIDGSVPLDNFNLLKEEIIYLDERLELVREEELLHLNFA